MRTSSTSSSLRVSPVPSPDCLRLQKPLTHRTKARARSVRGTPQLSQPPPPPSPRRPPRDNERLSPWEKERERR
ncbi:hypothetical protein F2P81_008226 [Scophthalmus maximus]|uniref:Uncharacterized protein n=1 Tax=Scophthalmus maximus TaxID=52904 RepID=A0A6A4TAL8_SCOMX|nr:hypothetical protein F2P81_008226 [Scophthalmus maximus]